MIRILFYNEYEQHKIYWVRCWYVGNTTKDKYVQYLYKYDYIMIHDINDIIFKF